MTLTASDKLFFRVFERRLAKAIRSAIPQKDGIRRACEYIVSGGAKRIRPLLMKRICDAAGKSFNPVVDAAVVVELIHNFSLVHDDLPCMDDSDYRRGRPSCHRKFSEPTALLAGDMLLSAAYGAVPRYSPELALRMVAAAAESVGQLIEGQLLDLKFKRPRKDGLIGLYARKTGSLFILSSQLAMLSLGMNKGAVFTRFGRDLGILFQATDDLLDAADNAPDLRNLADNYYQKTLRSIQYLKLPHSRPLEDYVNIVYERIEGNK